MDATELLIPSELIRLQRSGNIHSVELNWNTATVSQIVLSTRDLIRLFGIPEDKKLMFHHLTFTGTDTGRTATITVDPKLKGRNQQSLSAFEQSVLGRIRMNIDSNGDHEDQPLYGLNCVDELIFADDGGSSMTWLMQFIFELVDGEMFLMDDLIENIGDIRQVEIDRTPGQEWFQLGPVTQINEGTGEDIP